MTIATLKNEIKDLKNALNTPLDEKLKAKLREQLSKSEKTLAEMESAKTATAKKNVTKKASAVAKKSTSVLQKIKKANKKVEPKKATTTKKPSVLQNLKSKIKLTKNLSGYKKSGIDLVRDADRPALPAGRRISKDGNVYYENRLNRVDIKQPPKRYPKLEDGGMMADGGKIYYKIKGNNLAETTKNGVKFNVLIGQAFDNQAGKERFYPLDFIREIALTSKLVKYQGEIWVETAKDKIGKYPFLDDKDFIEALEYLDRPDIRKIEDGKYMAKGGVSEKPMSYYRYETPKVTIYWKGKLQPLGVYKSAEEAYEVIKKQSAYNNDISDYEIRTPDKVFKFSNGGMMAKGGFVSKGQMVWGKLSGSERMKFLNENFTPSITPRSQEILVDKTFVFLPKEVKIKLEEKFANIEPNEDGKYMADGGRLKSAIMRDRAYKSNEPHEQAYTRKSRPKNPKYNYGFFADGGETEMHRAYAMGGVLQHGLEAGDFIVSHDEGKMVVMNGGSKYEVNIHSGSRTKID